MFEINGHTKQLGIIGYPVEHTFSPNMHNFISETVHNNYVYGAWCVKPEDLKDAIGGIIQTQTAFVWHLQKRVLKSKTAEYL